MAKSICFVGLDNLPVLAREYGGHGVGGAQLQQTLLAKALRRRGLDVSMVVSDLGQPDGAEWDGIKTYRAYRATDGLPGLRFLHPRLTGIWGAMKRANAEVYYVSCAGMLIAHAVAFARVHGRKTIFRVASDSDCDPGKLLVRLNRDKKLYAWGLRRAGAILAQTPVQQQALRRNYGVDSVVARSMADLDGGSIPLEGRDIDVLWVSNIQQLKRPDMLLDLAAQLPTLKFQMVGGPMTGHGKLFDEMRRHAESLPNVVFNGAVPYHDARTFYSRTKLLVNTSEIEGFPNTYLQAWANCTPVVAFHDPNGVIAANGLGHAARDVADMKNAIVRLLSPDHWEPASEASRRFVVANYGDDATLTEYLRVLEAQ